MYDARHWKLVSEEYPAFEENPTYPRLRMITDGFSLFHRYSRRSSWPIIYEFLNLPPALRKKFDNILFAGLTIVEDAVPGKPIADDTSEEECAKKEKPSHELFRAILRRLNEVFLLPLWQGVAVLDGTLRGILVSTQHDSQGGCLCHNRSQGGYVYCLHCLEHAIAYAREALSSKGNVLTALLVNDFRRHLPAGHPLRQRVCALWPEVCEGEAAGSLDFGLVQQLMEAAAGDKAATAEARRVYGLVLSSAFMELPYAEKIQLVNRCILPVRGVLQTLVFLACACVGQGMFLRHLASPL